MGKILQALNKPVDALRAKDYRVAWGLVVLTILINTVLEPILQYVSGSRDYKFDLRNSALAVLFSIATYLTICAAIWLVCKCFGSKASFGSYLKTWGLTYFPTLLCSFVVAFTEAYFYLFWNNVIWGMVLNILFVGILLWKTVLYVIYLREIAGLKRSKMVGAFIIIGVAIALLAAVNGYLGIKSPVL